MDEKQMAAELAEIKQAIKQNKKLPKGKMGLIKKFLLGTGGIGGGREIFKQLQEGDMSLKDILLGTAAGPITTTRDFIKGLGNYMQNMNQGGMAEMRKKGMGLKMANGGMANSKFPDLSGDGKITQKDILMGKGVIKKAKGGVVKKKVTKRKPKARGTGSAIKGTKFKGVF
jgi:hypothetical protein